MTAYSGDVNIHSDDANIRSDRARNFYSFHSGIRYSHPRNRYSHQIGTVIHIARNMHHGAVRREEDKVVGDYDPSNVRRVVEPNLENASVMMLFEELN